MTRIVQPVTFESLSVGQMTDSRFPGISFELGHLGGLTETIMSSWKDGTQNPDWRVQVLRNVDASTPYSVRYIRFSPAYSDVEARSQFSSPPEWPSVRVKSRFFTRNLTAKDLIDDREDEDLREIALRRLKQRLSSDVGQYSALAPLAELRELRGLIRTTADSATKLVRSLLSLKRKSGIRGNPFKNASDLWLSWSFGIKPTINDTANLAKSIAYYLESSDRRVRLVGSAERSWTSSSSSRSNAGPYGVDMNYNASGVHRLSYKYTGGMALHVSSANGYEATDHFGITANNLPSVAWELAAYSWLVDYFTTVGAWLDDAFQSPPGDLTYLVLNRKYVFEGTCNIEPGRTYNGTDFRQYRNNKGQLSVTVLDRRVLPTIPHLALRFKTADEIGINAVNRLLNLTALLVPGTKPHRL